MKKIIIISLSLFYNFVLFANDGYYKPGSGGTIIPIKNENISMENEIINITVDKYIPEGYIISYDCNFTFKNNSNSNENILMAFPIELAKYADSGNSKTFNKKNDIIDFQVSINNKSVFYRVYSDQHNPDIPEIPEYGTVFGFDVSFGALETKSIRNSYLMRINNDTFGLNYNPVRYILKSGLTWNNKIKVADINIKFNFPIYSNKDKHGNLFVTPPNYIFIDNPQNIIKFHFEDFFPENDINILFHQKPMFPHYMYYLASIFEDKLDKNNAEKIGQYNIFVNPQKVYELLFKYLSTDDIPRVIQFIYEWNGYNQDKQNISDEEKYLIEHIDLFLTNPVKWDTDIILMKLEKKYLEQPTMTNYADFINFLNTLVYERIPIAMSNKKAKDYLFKAGDDAFNLVHYSSAESFYRNAFKKCKSNLLSEDSYKELLKRELSLWLPEDNKSTPSYYIAYNLCCICSLYAENTVSYGYRVNEALGWLEIALKLGYPNFDWLYLDKDIKYLRDTKNKEFIELVKKYKGIFNQVDR